MGPIICQWPKLSGSHMGSPYGAHICAHIRPIWVSLGHVGWDGYNINHLTAATAVGQDVSKSLRINSQASIFTAELVALNLSLDIIRRSKRKKNLPSSQIHYQVFWPLITAILKQVMYRNLSWITAEIFLVLLEILGFIVSCDFTFIV